MRDYYYDESQGILVRVAGPTARFFGALLNDPLDWLFFETPRLITGGLLFTIVLACFGMTDLSAPFRNKLKEQSVASILPSEKLSFDDVQPTSNPFSRGDENLFIFVDTKAPRAAVETDFVEAPQEGNPEPTVDNDIFCELFVADDSQSTPETATDEESVPPGEVVVAAGEPVPPAPVVSVQSEILAEAVDTAFPEVEDPFTETAPVDIVTIPVADDTITTFAPVLTAETLLKQSIMVIASTVPSTEKKAVPTENAVAQSDTPVEEAAKPDRIVSSNEIETTSSKAVESNQHVVEQQGDPLEETPVLATVESEVAEVPVEAIFNGVTSTFSLQELGVGLEPSREPEPAPIKEKAPATVAVDEPVTRNTPNKTAVSGHWENRVTYQQVCRGRGKPCDYVPVYTRVWVPAPEQSTSVNTNTTGTPPASTMVASAPPMSNAVCGTQPESTLCGQVQNSCSNRPGFFKQVRQQRQSCGQQKFRPLQRIGNFLRGNGRRCG